MAINNNPNNQVPTYQNTPNNEGRASQRGTGFTNLSRVLNANKNNQLASTVSSGVNNQVNQAKTGIQSGLNTFNEAANKGRLDTEDNRNKRETTINNAEQATDQDADQFNTFRSGRYDGPTELANKTQLVNQANQASTLGQMAGTAEGRQGLLQRFAGGAGYTQGKQRLDSMLLGQSGDASLKGAYRDARGLNQQVDSANTSAEQLAKTVAAQNKAFGADTVNQLQNSMGSIYDVGQGRMNDWKTDQANLISGITEAGKFTQGQNDVNLTQAQADALTKGGLDLNNPYIYNTNLGDVISKSGYNPTLNAAVKAEEAARAKGLGKLSGSDINEQGTALLAGIADPTKYGTLADQAKLDASQGKLDQSRSAAQENALRQYYNTGINQPGRDIFGNQFNVNPFVNADDYINQVKNGTELSGYGGVNQATAQNNLNNGVINSNTYNSIQDALNTGGDYASKSAMERALDAARANSVQANDPYIQSLNNMFGPGANASANAGTDAANNYGRLRKILVGGNGT